MTTAQELLVLDEVTVRRSGRYLVQGVSWRIRPGEHWVILAPNGAGKTTILQIASGYLAPTSGTVHILGSRVGRTDVRLLRRKVGYAGPAPARLVRSHLPALEIVVTGLHAAFVDSRWHRYREADWERARSLLARLHAAHLARRGFGTLSEGERQRVLIARSLMPAPDLLLLDEPAADLDLGARERLLASLDELADDPEGPALVLVTHHVEDIPRSFDRMLLMDNGTVRTAGPLEQTLTAENLSACFEIPLQVQRLDGRYRAWRDE